MNSRGIIYGLILIIAGLGAGLVYLLARDPVFASNSSVPASQTNLVTQVAVRKINSTNYFLLPSGFRWSSLESTNYFTYVQNLRAVGCPEETVRDIIIADVAKLYQRRRLELVDVSRPIPFWKLAEPLDLDQQQALHALELEEKKLVRDLLGVDLMTELAKYGLELPARPADLSFLAGEKQTRIRLAIESHAAQEAALRDRSAGLWTEVDDDALRQLNYRQESEIKGLLTPEEFAEYQLRFSPLSAQMRQQLQGFETSEDEFRKIFRLRKSYEDALYSLSAAPSGAADSDKVADFQNQGQSLMAQELKNELGAQRFERYQKELDPSFQTLSRLRDRFGLTGGVVDQAYSYLKMAESHTQQLLNNPDLDPDRRDEALQAIERETDTELRKLIGSDPARVLRGALGR